MPGPPVGERREDMGRTHRVMKRLGICGVTVGLVAVAAVFTLGAARAHAVPLLQIYIEGGAYDDATQSWIAAPEGSSGRQPFRLWTIGNVSGKGGQRHH